MMRASYLLRSLLRFLAFLAALLLLSFSSSAQTLSVELGFEGRLTPGHYAPILIEVHAYQDVGSSRLRITQVAGNAWRGEATLQQELSYAVQSSGQYEAIIPVYDPVNPIIVELISSTDAVLAAETIDLRGTMRPMPYPVLDKQLPRFDDRAAVVDPSSLPTHWWGFDSAESLWVASALPSETWTAISQWVLAGGSLVVLTGTNFYRMDSPMLRELLPISNPEVTTTGQGTSYLTGSHANATIDLISAEGFPLLLHSAYGAGQVALISIGAQSVSVEDLQLIGAHIAPSRLLTLQEPTELILGAETVLTLNSLLVLVMIVLLGGLVCVCSVIGRRKPRLGWAILLVCAFAITVSSGFASNPTTHTVDLYTVTTHLYVQDVVSFLSVSSSSYSRISETFAQMHNDDILPLQFLPRTLKGPNSYHCLTVSGSTEQQLSDGEMRQWHAYGTASSVFDLEFPSDTVVRISNTHPTDFDAAWILINGTIYPIAKVQRGNHEYVLDPASSLSMSEFISTGYVQHASSVMRLVRDVKDILSLSDGIWLIATANEVRLVTEDVTQKVRDITLVIARGEEGGNEI